MSAWLVDLLILFGIIAIVAIAGWFILQQISLPEPIQKILIIVLVVVAAIIGVMILLHLRGGVKLANEPFRAEVRLLAAHDPAGAIHHRAGALNG